MKFRKVLALTMACCLVGSLSIPAFADEKTTEESFYEQLNELKEKKDDLLISPNPENEEKSDIIRVDVKGTIKSITDNIIILTTEDGEREVKISSWTQILEGKSGYKLVRLNLTAGDTLIVNHSTWTKEAEEKVGEISDTIIAKVIIKMPVEEIETPRVHVVEKVEVEENGDVAVLTDNGSLIVRFPQDKIVETWGANDAVDYKNITIGSEILVWYDIVARSFPGQAYSKEANLINYGSLQETLTINKDKLTVSYQINDDTYSKDIGQIKKIETEDYMELRPFIEALGPNYNVGWDPINGIYVDINSSRYLIMNGSPEVHTDNSGVLITGDELCVIVRDGITYIPVSFATKIFRVTTVRAPLEIPKIVLPDNVYMYT